MLHQSSWAASAASILLVTYVQAQGLYLKNSPVLQVSSRNYDSLITNSNHTSIVEFYAPWCGHCQNLKPAYEKAAKNLKGLAKVAAVNCDESYNKEFCGRMGVKGFPTLKIVRPTRKKGMPTVEDYQGARSAKAIVNAVAEKIPNHVKRITENSLDNWLKESNETAKAILFTEKSNISALLRSLAIDFLGHINFGQIRNKEKKIVDEFDITKFPTLVLLPGGEKVPVVYDGEMDKDALSQFFRQIAEPNPDPAPEPPKGKKEKKDRKKTSDKGDERDKTAAEEVKESIPKDDTAARPPPRQEPVMPIADEATIKERCLSSTSKICALLLLPEPENGAREPPEEVIEALMSLGQVYEKHTRRKAAFPFYVIDPRNPFSQTLRDALSLSPANTLEVIAVNGKRAWWRRLPLGDATYNSIEAWVDAIRMNEGKREKLPESLINKIQADDEDDESTTETKSGVAGEKSHDEL